MGAANLNREHARQVQRDRAVLREGVLRDRATARIAAAHRHRKHQPINLTDEQARHYPLLTAYLARSGQWPPSITRKHADTLRAMDTMYALGDLALIRLSLRELDDLPLKSSELVIGARATIADQLQRLTSGPPVYAAAVKRGIHGGTHAHLVLPARYVNRRDRARLAGAPAGCGSPGVMILQGAAHGVRIADTPTDRARVARYLSRDPDERLDDPTHPAYLDALEDELRRKQTNAPRVRLAWTTGITTLRRTGEVPPHY